MFLEAFLIRSLFAQQWNLFHINAFKQTFEKYLYEKYFNRDVFFCFPS